jgi:uncharacterized protein (TIGR02996 family)
MPKATSSELPPPRPELAALLAAAKEQPEDEAPLFVLADWLEDQPDADDRSRGELVRVEAQLMRVERQHRLSQVARSINRLDTGPFHVRAYERLACEALFAEWPDVVALTERAVNLRQTARQRWSGPLLGHGVYFTRGLAGLNCRPKDFPSRLMNAVAASELGCWVREVKFQHCKPVDVTRICNCSLLAQLAELALNNQNVGTGVWSLASSPHLKRLVSLNLTYSCIGADGTRALGSTELPALRELRIAHNHFSTRGAEVLAAASWLGGLRLLDLAFNEFVADTTAALLARQTMPHLEWLNLSNNKLGPEGVDALFAPGRLPALRGLSLSDNAIGPAGLSRLLAWPGLRNLTTLLLDGCLLRDEGAEAIAGCAALTNLTSLSLARNLIGDRGLLALASSPHLRNLASLDVNSNHVGPAGVAALANPRNLPALVWVKDWGNDFGGPGSAAPRWRFPRAWSA